MGKSQKKRLLAASERFRRDYVCYFYGQKTFPDGVTRIGMHIEKRIHNRRRAWK